MKKTHLITLVVFAITTLFTSCIQEEAPNAECDIVSVDTTHTWFRDNKDLFTEELKIKNNKIIFILKENVNFESIDISHESIIDAFTLTPGARIEAIDTVKRDNGISLTFKTHSEDGIWHKEYEVSFTKTPRLECGHVFGFENIETDIFNNWYEINEDGIRSYIWSSGNMGFKTSGMAQTAADYPTACYDDGFSGRCVKLTTCSTGDFGKKAKMPIAAGNIFIGDFNSASAMLKPLKATRFGKQILPPKAKPVKLTGYYKYTAGEVFTDRNMNVVENQRDTCDIYAVLFETEANNFKPLDGSDIKTSNRIVLIANTNLDEPTEWTKFEIPFEQMNGKEFDYKKLKNNEYAITVVASSSKGGAVFEGAIGSTLFIDEIKIEWEVKE